MEERFRRVENEFFRLKGQLAIGRVTQEQVEATLKQMILQDEQGNYWMLGSEGTRWYIYDGKSWVQGVPPSSEVERMPVPPSEVERMPVPSQSEVDQMPALPRANFPAPPHQPSSSGTSKSWLVAVVGFVLVCICLAAFFGVATTPGVLMIGLAPSPTFTATPTPTLSPTSIPTLAPIGIPTTMSTLTPTSTPTSTSIATSDRGSTPTRTQTRAPTFTPTPWSTATNVTFIFDDAVPAANRTLIQEGIAIAQGSFGPVTSMTVRAYTSLDTLMDAYCRLTNIKPDSAAAKAQRKGFDDRLYDAFAVMGGMFIYVRDSWVSRSPSYQKQTMLHEYFHVMQYDLAKGKALLPKWLVEGSAEYSTYRVAVRLNLLTEEYVANAYPDRVWGLNGQLSSVETSDEVRLEDISGMYILGYVATEYIEKTYGESLYKKKYWEALGAANNWQDAFRNAFGMPVEDLYNKFEQYRHTEYPALCGPGGNQVTLGMNFNRQLPPGTFYADPPTYIPYVFCVTGSSVGSWTPQQQREGFGKPAGVGDPLIHSCGGSCVELAIRPDTPAGTYIFTVAAPDGRKAEAAFQFNKSSATLTPHP
jgi:hypothetical protein